MKRLVVLFMAVLSLSALSFATTHAQTTPTSTPTPTPASLVKNKISWKTGTVSLEADDFFIKTNGQIFKAESARQFIVRSDPGTNEYTTLEASWTENGVEMRLFIYFAAVHTQEPKWYVTEIRTYNGLNPGNWVYYPGSFLEEDVGTGQQMFQKIGIPFLGKKGFVFSMHSSRYSGEIHFENLHLQPFLGPIVTTTTTPTPSPIPIITRPVNNRVSWKTETTSIEADNFYILVGDKYFGINQASLKVQSAPTPANDASLWTTFTAEWEEYGLKMHIQIYFITDRTTWRLGDNIRTNSDQSADGWIYYNGYRIGGAVGKPYEERFFEVTGFNDRFGWVGAIHFDNLKIQPFIQLEPPIPGDLNGDGSVTILDFSIFARNFGKSRRVR